MLTDVFAATGAADLLASPLIWLPFSAGRTSVRHNLLRDLEADQNTDVLCFALKRCTLLGTLKVGLMAGSHKEAVTRTRPAPLVDTAARIASLLVTGLSSNAGRQRY